MRSGMRLQCARAFGLSAVFAVLAGMMGTSVRADEELPKSLACEFTAGTSWTYEAGAFTSKAPNPLKFSIDAIDLEAQTATLGLGVEGQGGKLNVVRAINANHFLEVVNEGFLNLTTVYDKDAATGRYPAVHSRHFGLLGQPVFSQHTGFCVAE